MTAARRSIFAFWAIVACLSGACAPRFDGRAGLPRRPILYQSQAPGGTEDLRMLVPETGASTVLLYGDSSTSRGLAVWSPDARRVAYIRESDVRDRLARSTAPILYLRGTEDRLVPEASAAAVVAAAPGTARVGHLAGLHLLLQIEPAAAWQAIEGFLATLPHGDVRSPAPPV